MLFIYPKYLGLPIIPSRTAMNELMMCDLALEDVAEVLETGFDCSRSARKEGTLERCVKRGKKTLKVVVVKSVNYTLSTECWVLTHAGVF